MTTDRDPKAHEMAMRCARAIRHLAGDSDSIIDDEITFLKEEAEVILRELNLESLLRDREIVNWIEETDPSIQFDSEANAWDINYTEIQHMKPTFREAALATIAQQEKEGKV